MNQDTVLIRHLPSSLTHQEISELLQHFGAKKVKIVGSGVKKSNLAYARFENDRAAEVGVFKLHQLNVLGQKISAEIARGQNSEITSPVEISGRSIEDEKQDCILKSKETFLNKFGLSIRNYDFNSPPPLNIRYQYPPPTKGILENICKAMANAPKLYNQVLHLMNKMNLPCPFTHTYSLESELFQDTNVSIIDEVRPLEEEKRKEEISTSENESELGSDAEHQPNEIIPTKRKKLSNKAIKRPKFVKPQMPIVQGGKVGLKPDDVFEGAQKEPIHKKIELKITSDLSSILEAQEIQAVETAKEGFAVMKMPQKMLDKYEESNTEEESNLEDTSFTFISAEQLAANRIPAKDQRLLPVYKNYQAGAPSCRLYIKNLAKQVETKDLHFIFRRYYQPELDEEQGSMFDIRLMQEGRMKGQAFITLQSVHQAQAALKDTNGYILKDKPMVVQFARSATAK